MKLEGSLSVDLRRAPSQISNLRKIEKAWNGRMANPREQRIRFAMWDVMRLSASLASGPSKRKILATLQADQELFDQTGRNYLRTSIGGNR